MIVLHGWLFMEDYSWKTIYGLSSMVLYLWILARISYKNDSWHGNRSMDGYPWTVMECIHTETWQHRTTLTYQICSCRCHGLPWKPERPPGSGIWQRSCVRSSTRPTRKSFRTPLHTNVHHVFEVLEQQWAAEDATMCPHDIIRETTTNTHRAAGESLRA